MFSFSVPKLNDGIQSISVTRTDHIQSIITEDNEIHSDCDVPDHSVPLISTAYTPRMQDLWDKFSQLLQAFAHYRISKIFLFCMTCFD